MSVPRATERSVLSHEQLKLVDQSHHPAIYGIDAKSLQGLQTQLRNERAKVQTQVRQKLREGRGKSEARGKSFPGNTEQPLKRKQALANALKRVNKELERVKIQSLSSFIRGAERIGGFQPAHAISRRLDDAAGLCATEARFGC